MITASRYHDFSCGHRVVGHEHKCRLLHGHNYRITFDCAGNLDRVGRVIDFGVMKTRLCHWLEEHWDHRLLLWAEDPLLPALRDVSPESVVVVPFNPTAENLADHLLTVVGPAQLAGTGVTLVRCMVEETRKCAATAELTRA
jgi:6-pyruvoyltetrahydropterin/6-carboxytetrahydropterin synthase